MRLIDWYIGRYVLRATGLALFVLVALFVFITFVDDLDTVGRGDYTLGHAVAYVILIIPRLAFSAFPVATLIGSLVGLGTLAANSELTVLRASGVSPRRITSAVMKTGAVLMIAALVIGEWVAPQGERLAEERRSLAIDKRLSLKTGYGLWIRDGESFVNVGQVLPGNRMQDIYIYDFDARRRLRIATHASAAVYADGKWMLEHVRQSEIGPEGVTQRSYEALAWHLSFAPELVEVVVVKPERLSALGLYKYLNYLKANDLDTAYYEYALWRKLVYPLATGVMIFLAIPLVLGKLRSASIGPRLVVGVLAGVGFHILQQVAGQAGVVYGISPVLSATAPTALFFAVAVVMMRRVR
nr:LPS export ABC transporter permease LptG [Gammaproteobacteria bacterium]